MLFGSDEMKDLLKEMMASPEGYKKNLPTLYREVFDYAVKRARKGFEVKNGSVTVSADYLSQADCEDIASAVVDEVLDSLDSFVANIDKYDARSRQGWLKKIVFVRFVRYIQKKQKSDPENFGRIACVQSDFDAIVFKETLSSVVLHSLKAPSKPEKILCFLMNILVFRVLGERRQNNPSVPTSDYVKGKTLFELNRQFKMSISAIYGFKLDPNITKIMDDKLGKDAPTELGQTICTATPKAITDWTNRMKDYLKLYQEEITNGGIFLNSIDN